VVGAFVAAINNPATIGQSYDLVGPEVYTLEQIVRYVDAMIGTNRKIIPLGPRLSRFLAAVMQFAPGKPLTPDNIASMSVDNVSEDDFPAIFSIQPKTLEQVAPIFLKADFDRLDVLRRRRG